MNEKPEWWGGAECTVNRVGDQLFDQLERTGHAGRLEDLDRLAALGIQRIRFPILWERTWCPVTKTYDFSWADTRLARLRELRVDPIVGLLHHGSGPLFTNLLEPNFPEQFAEFAGQVARRYPWIRHFMPINEILTTARFSGLYGHWYPHRRDDRSFVRALLNQVRGTQLAMRAIRRHSPDAQLVNAEDLGTIFATPQLMYQARFENERRWLALDLLAGRVHPGHSLYSYLTDAGASAIELAQLAAERCRPSVIGINYYVTSDRFLDHRLEHYPARLHGGNRRHAYADVEAVRLDGVGIVGHYATLLGVWERYATPVALTEVHLGCCDEEEQALWLEEAWNAACDARWQGIDVCGVTAWSLFGAYDWNSLVTRCEDHYEAGVFDARCDPPRATLGAEMIRSLALGAPRSPQTGDHGWWRRPERSMYPAYQPQFTEAREHAELGFSQDISIAEDARFNAAHSSPKHRDNSGVVRRLH